MNALIEEAVRLLKDGKLIGLPTETVYGLAADAKNEAAVSAVFEAKGRPADHPLIVHIGTHAELHEWAINIPDEAFTLTHHYWPGPLTLVLERHPQVSNAVTGNQNTVAIRMPQHPLALRLLQAYGSGLVAPSANRFGRISPTDEAAVSAELGDAVSLILPGGRTSIGIESTILALHQKPFVLLREGMINQRDLENFLGQLIVKPDPHTTVRAPGGLASHYAPETPVKMLDEHSWQPYSEAFESAIVLSRSPAPHNLPAHFEWWTMPSTPDTYAHELYATLRRADSLKPAVILVEALPHDCAWLAIGDRLARASFCVPSNKTGRSKS